MGHNSKREGEQRFHFEPKNVRYLRIEGLGNERFQNRFNELKLFGPSIN